MSAGAGHVQRDGCEKNKVCPYTIVHAVPHPDTPPNHQPITAFDMDGEYPSLIYTSRGNYERFYDLAG